MASTRPRMPEADATDDGVSAPGKCIRCVGPRDPLRRHEASSQSSPYRSPIAGFDRSNGPRPRPWSWHGPAYLLDVDDVANAIHVDRVRRFRIVGRAEATRDRGGRLGAV